MAKRPEYETCEYCTHTKNIHTDAGCNAYQCVCEGYV